MRLLILTGMSGSGKTSALRALEDRDFFCVDNLPVQLLPTLIAYLEAAEEEIPALAVVVDMRERRFLERWPAVFRELREAGVNFEVFFLEAETQVLLRRFEETRRRHPLAAGRTLLEGIEWEREQLTGLRERADRVIDTSPFNIHELRGHMAALAGEDRREGKRLQVELISFSYAKGLPPQADLVMDVRFLPNPHYDPVLKDRDGRDPEVQSFVRRDEASNEILGRFFDLVTSVTAFYETEDRSYLVLAMGCTGGRHRSVAVVCEAERRLRALGYAPVVFHRDIDAVGGRVGPSP